MGNKTAKEEQRQQADHDTPPEQTTRGALKSPPPLPRLVAPATFRSEFIDDENIKFLAQALPEERRKKWTLLYSSKLHGKSFNRFCFNVEAEGPCLVLLREVEGERAVFGGYAAEPWRRSPRFHGNASCFVFQLRPQRRLHRATGFNDHFQYLNYGTETLFNGVGMGGQIDYFTWAIRDSFDTGMCRGSPDSTFGATMLSSTADWTLDCIEVWQVAEPPADNVELEKIRKKKQREKSVLDDEDNADKVIKGLSGHEFSNEENPRRTATAAGLEPQLAASLLADEYDSEPKKEKLIVHNFDFLKARGDKKADEL